MKNDKEYNETNNYWRGTSKLSACRASGGPQIKKLYKKKLHKQKVFWGSCICLHSTENNTKLI